MSEKMIIVGKIDVTKVNKDRLFAGKNGAKYLDVVLVETPGNQYGDHFMITESVTKEERAANVRGTILGNAKFLRGNPNGGGTSEPRAATQAPLPAAVEGGAFDDVPF